MKIFHSISNLIDIYLLITYENRQNFLFLKERTYPLRCQFVDQDIDRDILSNLRIL